MPNLVLTHDSLSVKLESESLVITRKAESPEGEAQRSHVPLFDLDRVIVLGRPEISTPVLHKFMKSGIPVSFLSAKGHWIGCLHPDKDMDAGRRICQYETARDKTLALKVATRIVGTKICNARRVLQRLSSTRGESVKDIQVQASLALDNLAAKGMQAESVDALRGYEGAAAAVYFSRLSSFFPPDVPFLERSRRPPGDAANALLSWTYAIVLGEIESAIRARGLDPCIGFLHSISHGTPSLALDLLEPLRPALCDLLVLHILNHGVLKADDFEFRQEDGGVYLKPAARKVFFPSYENSMTRQFKVERGLPRTDFRKVIDSSVLSIVKAIEGHDDFDFFQMP